MARPRPVRALVRTRLDAPVLGPLPHGLRTGARRSPAVPPARLAHPRAPRVRAHQGRRGHHRAARPGHLQRGRLRAGRAHARRPLQPRRPRHRRPPHVLHLLGRRPRGGRLGRGVVDRGPPRARPPDRLLRRQPHLDRGRHEDRLHRGPPRALRGLRLARAEPRRGDRARPPRGGGGRGPGGRGPAQPDRLPHPHRAGRAAQAGHRSRARLAAGRGGDPAHQGVLRLPVARAVLRARRGAAALPLGHRPGQGASRPSGRSASPPTRTPTRTRARSSSGCSRAACPTASPTPSRRASTPTRA